MPITKFVSIKNANKYILFEKNNQEKINTF